MLRNMADEVVYDSRMSDSDALMWNIERDPVLRSTITGLWLLDAPPAPDRLGERIERATRLIPRLRQRVAANPFSIAPPRWEVDPDFDRLDTVYGAGYRWKPEAAAARDSSRKPE